MVRNERQLGMRLANRSQGWIGPAVITAAFLLLVALVDPLRQFPVQDDWDYSRTVWNLVQTGVFHRLEGTQATVVFPAAWGSLWVRAFGFSFATLRISTLVLAWGALLLFYGLLGELGFDLPRRLLGTATLMVAPAFVYLSFSFMTDVPFLFGYLGALACYVRALQRDDLRFAVLGSVFAALAFLARQIGLLAPVAFGLLVLAQRWPRGWRGDARPPRPPARWLLAACLLPILAAVAFFVYVRFLGGANWADRARTTGATIGFLLRPGAPGIVAGRLAMTAATIGVYLLPLWLAALAGWSAAGAGWRTSAYWQKALLVVAGLGLALVVARLASQGSWFPYLTDILTGRGFRPYLAYAAYDSGAYRPPLLSAQGSAALTALAAGLGVALICLAIGQLGAHHPPELLLVYLTTALLALASLLFFSYYERYLLPLLPGAIVLLLDVSRRVRLSLGRGALGFVVVAVASVLLMRDYFAWNEAKWDAGRALLDRGVAVERIDGGMEWDAWYLYNRSIATIQAQGLPMTIAPWLYVLDPQYIFAFQPTPGYRTLQTVPFDTPLRAGGQDRLYLLEREPYGRNN